MPLSRPTPERELSRIVFRKALFQRRGMNEADADALALRLAERDADRDDRRTCIECRCLQRSRTCLKRQPITVDHFQLIRCPFFEWQKPA